MITYDYTAITSLELKEAMNGVMLLWPTGRYCVRHANSLHRVHRTTIGLYVSRATIALYVSRAKIPRYVSRAKICQIIILYLFLTLRYSPFNLLFLGWERCH